MEQPILLATRSSWKHMKSRCYWAKDPAFKYYGGRGIKVCDRWLKSFEDFQTDMGPRPSLKHSIDRYPNQNGDYCPENTRWANQSQQMRNTRRNLLATINGETKTAVEWAEVSGVSRGTVVTRIVAGVAGEKILSKEPLLPRYAHDGKWLTLHEWSDLSGVSLHAIRHRVGVLGWPIETAISTPVTVNGRAARVAVPKIHPPGYQPKPRQGRRFLTHNGETLPIRDWLKRLGLSSSGFWHRVHTLKLSGDELFAPSPPREKKTWALMAKQMRVGDAVISPSSGVNCRGAAVHKALKRLGFKGEQRKLPDGMFEVRRIA